MSAATFELSVLSCVASAVTITLSVSDPTVRLTSCVADSDAFRMSPVCSNTLNPFALTLSVYAAGGSSVKM